MTTKAKLTYGWNWWHNEPYHKDEYKFMKPTTWMNVNVDKNEFHQWKWQHQWIEHMDLNDIYD